MSEETKAEPILALAEHWARKGAAEVEKMDATIIIARQLMASEQFQPYAEGENPFEPPPYPWEVSEPQSDALRRIFVGAVSDFATGTGHTVYFAASLARDEDEFRRQLAAHIGHTFANGATVKKGLRDFPFSKAFISPSLRQKLHKFDQGRNAPASFSYIGRWHENRS